LEQNGIESLLWNPIGVWVYINEIKKTTEQATNELLIKGKLSNFKIVDEAKIDK
jgi:hypothetical protein